jgi:hypothetical protein
MSRRKNSPATHNFFFFQKKEEAAATSMPSGEGLSEAKINPRYGYNKYVCYCFWNLNIQNRQMLEFYPTLLILNRWWQSTLC